MKLLSIQKERKTVHHYSTFYIWMVSLRLKTIPLASCGILTGTALAWAYGVPINLWIFLFSFSTAVLLQLTSNLANDYGDMSNGGDTEQRIGPNRGLQYGLIRFAQMKRAIVLVSTLTLLSGITLVLVACQTWLDILAFIVFGGVSLFAALTYTMSKHAYGYYGLGDLSVLIFFGFMSVMGSFYLQTHHIGLYSFLPATACGLLSVLVLNVNNMRDIQEDSQTGKRTLAVRLGREKIRYYHLALLGGSLFCLCLFAVLYELANPYIWLFLLALPLFYFNGRAVLSCKEPVQLQNQLVVAIKINIFTLTLFSAGLFLT